MAHTIRSRARWLGRVRRDGEVGDDWARHAPTYWHQLANRRYRQRCRDDLRAGGEPRFNPRYHPTAHAVNWYW